MSLLGVTILLSLTVFLLLVAETMPPTSDAVPLIGLFYKQKIRLRRNHSFYRDATVIFAIVIFLLKQVSILRNFYIVMNTFIRQQGRKTDRDIIQ